MDVPRFIQLIAFTSVYWKIGVSILRFVNQLYRNGLPMFPPVVEKYLCIKILKYVFENRSN